MRGRSAAALQAGAAADRNFGIVDAHYDVSASARAEQPLALRMQSASSFVCGDAAGVAESPSLRRCSSWENVKTDPNSTKERVECLIGRSQKVGVSPLLRQLVLC